MLTKKDCKNTVTWQIDSWKKLFKEIDGNPNAILKMILDMHTIYTKYLNQANNGNK